MLAILEIFKDAVSKEDPNFLFPKKCVLCLSNEANETWPCLHKFCKACTHTLHKCYEKGNTTSVLDPTSTEFLNPHLCPYCRTWNKL